jgi:hypothetical protein
MIRRIVPALRGATVVLALAACGPGWARANCGAEGCPFAPQGPEAAHGRYSFDVAYQAINQDRLWQNGHAISEEEALAAEGGIGHILEQETRTRTLTLNARARLTDAIMLTASWPWVDRFHRHELAHHAGFFIPSEWHFQGPGDASLIGSWRAWGGANPTAATLTLQGGIKLPTGQRHVEEVNGEEPEPPVRPGSGSTDGQLGLQWSRVATMRTVHGERAGVPLSVSLVGRWNGVGTEGYRTGSELQLALGGGYPVTRWAHAIAQINAVSHGRDDVGQTDATPGHTGGTAVYASPGLRLEVAPGLTAYAYWQARLYQYTSGPQLSAPYHLSFGTAYALGR